MTPEEQIVSWIESSQEHYKRLLEITRRRQPGCADGFIRSSGVAAAAHVLVCDAYQQMLRGDIATGDEYSAAEILRAAANLTEWESPE